MTTRSLVGVVGALMASCLLIACQTSGAGSSTANSPTTESSRFVERDGLIEERGRLPVTIPGLDGASRVELDALLIKPKGAGPFPLAIINHGSPRSPADRAGVSPNDMRAVAEALARRGWAAVSLVRRGYGRSGGVHAEGYGACAAPDYLTAGVQTAQDIKAAIVTLKKRSDIDGQRIIAIGRSAGGFGSVALGADPVPGLVAVINFAGGRGSVKPDRVCAEDRLVATMRQFGATSRVPSLWVYAVNDHYFGPALADRLYQAFTSAGGDATFKQAPAFESDGHKLLSARGLPIWAPLIDDFLKPRGLPTG